MRMLLTAALALCASAQASRAALIDGTWSFAVSSWYPCTCALPAVPTTGSVRYAFDDTTNFINAAPVSPADYTDDFGATSATFSFFQGAGEVALGFVLGSAHFSADFVNPPGYSLFNVTDLDYSTLTLDGARTLSGGFTPAPAPEPVPAPLMLLGLGLLLSAHRRRQACPAFCPATASARA